MNIEEILPRGTKLENKRSHNQVTIVDIFPALSQKTNWKVVIEYRCFNSKNGKYTYILETELHKYEIIKRKEILQ